MTAPPAIAAGCTRSPRAVLFLPPTLFPLAGVRSLGAFRAGRLGFSLRFLSHHWAPSNPLPGPGLPCRSEDDLGCPASGPHPNHQVVQRPVHGLGNVRKGDEADELPCLDHRQSLHLPFGHEMGRIEHVQRR